MANRSQSLYEPRAWPRYRVSVLAEAADPLSGKRATGLTRDISRGGCFVVTPDALIVGALVQLCIRREEIAFETLASVVRAIPGEGVGFAFLDTRVSQMEILERWLSELAK